MGLFNRPGIERGRNKNRKGLKNFPAVCSFLLVLLLCRCLGPLHAAAFEMQGLGARSSAMGGAFVAVLDDYESVFWNPSGIAHMQERTFYSSYRNPYGLGMLRYIGTGYVHSNVGKGAIAFSWLRLDTVGEAGFLDYTENTLVFTYATHFFKPLLLGINGKYYRVNSSVGAGGMGLDFGLAYEIHDPSISVGLAVQDLNRTVITWDSGAKDRMPLRLRAGVSGKPFKGTLLSTQVSWQDQEKSSQRYHAGIEQELFKRVLALRFGGSERDNLWRVAWGLGLRVKFFTFDYGWEREGRLGDSHQFSASIKF